MSEQSNRMQSYEAYRDSGMEWLKYIPAHWRLFSNKYIFSLKKKQVGKNSSDYDLLSLTLKGIIKRDMENPEGKFPAEFDAYQEVSSGDFVFCLFDVEETPRTVGLSPFHGMITGAYTVFEANPEFCALFLYYFYLNLDSKKMLRPLYKGLRNTIPKDYFLGFKTFVPPIKEQIAIVTFLDHKTAQIEQAIAIKQQQITLLKERRQVLIQNAVTRGLDPEVAMRDSGVEWIGDIPAHWEVQPIKYSLNGIVDCEHKTAPFIEEENYLVVRTSNVKEGKLQLDDAKYTDEKSFNLWTRRGTPKAGDILLTREAPAGEACLVPYDKKLCLGQRMVWLKVDREKILPQFVVHLTYSNLVRTYIDFLSAGSTVLHLNMSDIRNIPIISMPLEEQADIVAHIETQSAKIDKSIALQQQQIDRLKEYKASLINSAVTGKIKVPMSTEQPEQEAVAG